MRVWGDGVKGGGIDDAMPYCNWRLDQIYVYVYHRLGIILDIRRQFHR